MAAEQVIMAREGARKKLPKHNTSSFCGLRGLVCLAVEAFPHTTRCIYSSYIDWGGTKRK